MPNQPSQLPQDQFDALLSDATQGIPIRTALVNRGISPAQFYAHLNVNDQAVEQYLRAKRTGCHAWADETVQILDQEPPRVTTAHGEATDNGWVNWQRNRAVGRQWQLARLMPGVYGERTTIDGGSFTVNLSAGESKL